MIWNYVIDIKDQETIAEVRVSPAFLEDFKFIMNKYGVDYEVTEYESDSYVA